MGSPQAGQDVDSNFLAINRIISLSLPEVKKNLCKLSKILIIFGWLTQGKWLYLLHGTGLHQLQSHQLRGLSC
jgi:hypothetical protein